MTSVLKYVDCIECGVHFGLPLVLFEEKRKHGGYFHCPNGHSQGWSKADSEDERVRRERDRLKQENARLAEEKERAEREKWEAIEAESKKRIAAERKLTRARKRHEAGVCLDCNRTFSQLARHMATKHAKPKCEAIPKFSVVDGGRP